MTCFETNRLRRKINSVFIEGKTTSKDSVAVHSVQCIIFPQYIILNKFFYDALDTFTVYPRWSPENGRSEQAPTQKL